MILDPDAGLLNYLTSLLGFRSRAWLADPSTSLLAVIGVDVWQWTPFMVLMMLAGLESLSPDHVAHEHVADRGPGRVRIEDTDAGQHVRAGDDGPVPPLERGHHLAAENIRGGSDFTRLHLGEPGAEVRPVGGLGS